MSGFLAGIGTVIVLSIAISLSGNRAIASETFNVRVTGSGETLSNARQDAVRQALQKAVTQLVIVDRAIENDEILRDKVMSTMNGFISAFDERKISRTGDTISVEADVVVSTSSIQNYLSNGASGNSTFSGSSAFAEAQRSIAQYDVRGEMLDRYFRGFPSSQYRVKLAGVKISESRPGYMDMRLEIDLDPVFVESVRSYLQQVSLRESRDGMNGNPVINDVNSGKAEGVPVCLFDDSKRLGHNAKGVCYLLPPGAYFSAMKAYFSESGRAFIDRIGDFFIGFVDESGAVISQCLVLQRSGDSLINSYGFAGGGAEDGSPFEFETYWIRKAGNAVGSRVGLNLWLRPQVVSAQVLVSSVDMQKVKGVAGMAVVGMAGRQYSYERAPYAFDLQAPPTDERSICRILSERARHSNALQ